MHRGSLIRVKVMMMVTRAANGPGTAFHDVPVKQCSCSISFKLGITPERQAFLSLLDIGGKESLKVKGFPQGHTSIKCGSR